MLSKGLPGFRDFPPEDFALRAHIFRVWRDVAARYGFEEYDGPPLEPLDLYTGKSGSEIVAQLYAFTDKGDREVALRPEMTPTLARMVGSRANGLKKPIRWFSIPQLFRYERQQRGRLREHFQLNCDLIGEAGPLADAEIIALSIDMMRGFGLGPEDVRVRVSDRQYMMRMLADLGIRDDFVPVVFQAIDRIEKDPSGARTLLEGQIDAGTVARIARLTDATYRAELRTSLTQDTHLGATFARLDELGVGAWIDFDPTIVRGLAYYTGTVFELFDAKRTLRAICGGGRYDTLLGTLGGADLPALGFGMGDVVLGELLKDRGLHPQQPATIDVFVASVTPDDVPEVLRTVRKLRDAGIRVEYSLNANPVGKQLNLANARGGRLALVIGPDDRAKNEVQLKDLAAKTQEAVSGDTVITRVSEILAAHRLTTHDSRLMTPHG
jgi:histidyl-tRNA synthetase